MDFGILFKRAGKVAAENSPAILTAIGVTGTLTTAYLAAKAGFKSVDVLKEAEEKKIEENRDGSELSDEEKRDPNRFQLTKKEQADAVWKLYTPAAASAALTVAAIICAVRVQDRRNAALLSAYTAAEKGFKEYREKTLEKVGKKKEQEVRDEIAQDHVTNNPASKAEIILVSEGSVLCRDEYSGRYFTSDMETIRKAENDINYDILNEGYASLTDFWDKIGISQTSDSDDLGWSSDEKFEIDYSTTLSENNRPCIAITFRNRPVPSFYRNTH